MLDDPVSRLILPHSNGSALRRAGRKASPEKRVRILEAAIALFTTEDYHRVLVDDIAERAGVGKGTVYRYFPSKEAVFLELVELAASRAGEVVRADVDSNEPALTRLRRAVTMTLEYFRRNEPFLAILYHEKVFRSCRERNELEQRRAELRSYFVRLIAEGIAEGSIRSDMEPLLGAIVLMSSVRGFLRNFGEQRTSQQLADQLLSIFFDGAAIHSERRGAAAAPSTLALDQAASLDPQTLARLDPLASFASGSAEAPVNAAVDLRNSPILDDGLFNDGSGDARND
jgi:AcrR family transcriptional regulator